MATRIPTNWVGQISYADPSPLASVHLAQMLENFPAGFLENLQLGSCATVRMHGRKSKAQAEDALSEFRKFNTDTFDDPAWQAGLLPQKLSRYQTQAKLRTVAHVDPMRRVRSVVVLPTGCGGSANLPNGVVHTVPIEGAVLRVVLDFANTATHVLVERLDDGGVELLGGAES